MNFEAFLTADGLIALVTLSVLEVVLGIDNVIFISILAGKLPKKDQEKARKIGLMAAMGNEHPAADVDCVIALGAGAAVQGAVVDRTVSGAT